MIIRLKAKELDQREMSWACLHVLFSLHQLLMQYTQLNPKAMLNFPFARIRFSRFSLSHFLLFRERKFSYESLDRANLCLFDESIDAVTQMNGIVRCSPRKCSSKATWQVRKNKSANSFS